jgi:hypothetical protein
MYLYITTLGLISLPDGLWSGGEPPTEIDSGLNLLTVNWDGTTQYYMLLANMS